MPARIYSKIKSWHIITPAPLWQLSVFAKKDWDLWRELLAGLTTFVTMAYAVIVNPIVLSYAGIPMAASFYATCITTACACFALGIFARSPLVIGPSMALNGYFITHLITNFHGDWSSALGAVCISGLLLFFAACLNWPKHIRATLPEPMIKATIIGIGILMLHVAILSANLFDHHSIQLANLNGHHLTGLMLTAALMWLGSHLQTRGHALISILISILVLHLIWPQATHTTMIWQAHSTTHAHVLSFNNMFITLINAVMLTFLIIFDSTSTIIAITENTSIQRNENFSQQKRLTLMITGLSTMLGSALGTSNMGVYFEGATGIDAKGRTGWCAIVVGLGFLACLLIAPYLNQVPTAIPAGILLVIAVKIIQPIRLINWKNWRIALPSLMTIINIPLTGAIVDGIGFGLLTYLLCNYKSTQIQRGTWLLTGMLISYLGLRAYDVFFQSHFV